MKKFLIWGVVVLGVLAVVVFALRLFTPEDTWVCDNGQWIMHGNPSSPMPTEACEGVLTGEAAALANCEAWFDGCNNCSVVDGKISACTLMYCETPGEAKCIKEKSVSDLSDCASWFDGCNTCTVVDGKLAGCTKMYCETPGEAKCLEKKTVGMANPASVNCEKKGGTLEIVTDANGGQSGMCHLSDGTTCEERAYMRGECGGDTSTSNPGSSEPGFAPGDEGKVCTMEYMPVCAEVQVQCIKAPCPPVLQTFGNKCTMEANSLAKYLYDGECKEGRAVDLTNCVSYYDGCNNCSVENGKVVACTEMYCETPGEAKCTQYK